MKRKGGIGMDMIDRLNGALDYIEENLVGEIDYAQTRSPEAKQSGRQ